jgi:3-oxoacyl-[acyl-carrier-protein] synthase-3
MRSVVRGTGIYLPETVVDNHALARIMDTSDEWIQARTGIKERRFADADQATSDMAVPAARQAVVSAGMTVDDIDYVIFATMTPDMYFPGSAPFLQAKLGLPNVPCLDIRQQCAGFLYGLQIADALVRSEQYQTVLVVGAEVHACFMPWSWNKLLDAKAGPVSPEEYALNTKTRDRTVLFGDGAGAVVLSPTHKDDQGIVDFLLRTDGNQAERLCTRAGGSAYRPYFRLAVRLMPQVTQELLERNQLTVDDVDMLIMHQANLRINEAAQQRLGLPDEKVFNNIQHYGNTTAGTIPIAYHEALEQGRIKPGDLVCFVALGSGLNWGAMLYRV